MGDRRELDGGDRRGNRSWRATPAAVAARLRMSAWGRCSLRALKEASVEPQLLGRMFAWLFTSSALIFIGLLLVHPRWGEDAGFTLVGLAVPSFARAFWLQGGWWCFGKELGKAVLIDGHGRVPIQAWMPNRPGRGLWTGGGAYRPAYR